MTLKQKREALSKITEDSYFITEYGTYKVIKIYKNGVQYIREWENRLGKFHKYDYVSYEELLEGNYLKDIII